ncbi:hypothetical protein [Klebsiella pneumoniae]|nr:hypothetical protein [Salmonella enterica subsp. enterica serovar Enteritidis]HAO0782623.1 hypothetical protein [Escherichia coli]
MIISRAERSAIRAVIDDCRKKARADAFEYTNLYMIIVPVVFFLIGLALYLFGYEAGSLISLFGLSLFGAAMCLGLVFVHGDVRYIGSDHVSDEHLSHLKRKTGRNFHFLLDGIISKEGYITYSELSCFLVKVSVPFKERLVRLKMNKR